MVSEFVLAEPLSRQLVKAPPYLSALFDRATYDQASFLKAVEQGIFAGPRISEGRTCLPFQRNFTLFTA